ncbi:MAG TPA: response regulator [Candidatus Acidoferrum sp.]|nr:response regulator [Candidatus Acidoferrum sp.]
MDPSTTVLLAEDSPDDALLMQRAFKAQGLTNPLRIVSDGAEAIAYLAGEGVFANRVEYPYPHLVILDLKMPRVTGFEVLEWLHARPDMMIIPTLVWSSSADARDVRHAYCLGANGYLVKPTDFQQFKQMLSDVFRFWDHCQKPAPNLPPRCRDVLDGKRVFGTGA